jgi:multimeric flavodoxin WrbA
MKVLGISCSPRKDGNTEGLVQAALDKAKEEGAEVELFCLSGKTIQPCDACYACRRTGECHIKDDMQELYVKMWEADGLVFGTPVYFWNVSAQAKALIDRTFAYSAQRNLRNKPVGAVVAQGRDGSAGALASLYSFFTGHRMIIVGNAIGFGNEKGSVKSNEQTMASAGAVGRAVVRYIKTGKI